MTAHCRKGPPARVKGGREVCPQSKSHCCSAKCARGLALRSCRTWPCAGRIQTCAGREGGVVGTQNIISSLTSQCGPGGERVAGGEFQ